MHKLIIPILMIAVLAACTGTKSDVTALLERAESFLPASPDSAEACLDSLGDGWTSPGSDGRALYGLLRTMTDAMQGRGIKSDSLIRPTYIYYKEQMDGKASVLQPEILKRRYARSAFYLAQYYELNDSLRKAMPLFSDCITNARTINDWRFCYMAYSHLSKITNWTNTHEAIHLMNEAIDLYHKIDDKPANLVSMLIDLGYYYLALESSDTALVYAMQAYDIAERNEIGYSLSSSLRCLSSIYVERKEYQQALSYAKKGMENLTPDTYDASVLILADCYLSCDSIDQAKQLLERIAPHANSRLSYSIYNKLQVIAMRTGDNGKSQSYSDSVKKYTGIIFSESQNDAFEYHKENQKLRKQNKEMESTSTWSNINIAILSICLFVAVAFIFLFSKRLLGLLNKSKRIIATHHLSECNSQTVLEEKMTVIKNLEQDLSSQQLLLKKQRYQARERQNKLCQIIINDSALSKKLRTDSNTDPLTDDEWQQLRLIIDTIDNEFHANIRQRYPSLPQRDIDLCILARMAYSNEIMAKAFGRTKSLIKKRKHYLMTEIFHQGDNILFEDFINQLSFASDES